LYLLDF